MLRIYRSDETMKKCQANAWFFFQNNEDEEVTFQVFGENTFVEIPSKNNFVDYQSTDLSTVFVEYLQGEDVLVTAGANDPYVVNYITGDVKVVTTSVPNTIRKFDIIIKEDSIGYAFM